MFKCKWNRYDFTFVNRNSDSFDVTENIKTAAQNMGSFLKFIELHWNENMNMFSNFYNIPVSFPEDIVFR